MENPGFLTILARFRANLGLFHPFSGSAELFSNTSRCGTCHGRPICHMRTWSLQVTDWEQVRPGLNLYLNPSLEHLNHGEIASECMRRGPK